MKESEKPSTAPGFRRPVPVSGRLEFQIIEAKRLDRSRSLAIQNPSTVVVIKIDNHVKFRTDPAQDDKWSAEGQITVDKASEIEIVVYDKNQSQSVPVGILWLKITDIAEGLRRRKIKQEQGPGWVTADDARTQNQLQPQQSPQHQKPEDDSIKEWFDVEPSGQLCLRLNFGMWLICITCGLFQPCI